MKANHNLFDCIEMGVAGNLHPICNITVREYLAAQAPKEIPRWFEPQFEPPPAVPHADPELVIGPILGRPLTRDQIHECHSWRQDGSWDLKGDLAPYQKAWEDYRILHEDWKDRLEIVRYFQWPYHWADMMIEQSDVPISHITEEGEPT